MLPKNSQCAKDIRLKISAIYYDEPSNGSLDNCAEFLKVPVRLKNSLADNQTAFYLQRGTINPLASGKGKSYARAVAAVCLLPILLPVKINASEAVPETGQPYVQLQQQIHEALRKEHPEWIEPNGDCPICKAYESRLAELLALSSATEYRSAA